MEKYYTAEEIAEALQMNVDTVQRWIRAGTLKGSKLGKAWRVSETELKKFIEERSSK